jgi:hypothetical protein
MHYQSFELRVDSIQYSTDTIQYDSDLDGIADIELTKYLIEVSPNDFRYGGKIYSIKNSMQFAYFYRSSLDFLNIGDIINERSNVIWLDTLEYRGGSVPINVLKSTQTFVPYIAIKRQRNANYFGWIRFNHLDFRELAISKNANQEIRIGQK